MTDQPDPRDSHPLPATNEVSPSLGQRIAEQFAVQPLSDERPTKPPGEGEPATVLPSATETATMNLPKLPGYEVLAEIAHGGMCAVLRVRDLRLQRELAVKVLLGRHQNDPQIEQRFLAEAAITGQLQHPGIVPIHELGRFDGDKPHFAMKLVQGRTLAKLLKERSNPQQDLPHFLQIFESVCQAVAFAHSRRVVHRDLKPLNVMVGEFGEVQVMDWELAKRLGPTEAAESSRGNPSGAATAGPETQAGAIFGTPAYMPPEQARGDIDLLDARADVFALGAILCEILTGKPAYFGGAAFDIITKA